jgi:tetratricopeptide (TPR) repeat protein
MRPDSRAGGTAGLILLTFVQLGVGRCATADDRQGGCVVMPDPAAAPLLVAYFEQFLDDRDDEAFRRKVAARYTEGTLARIVASGRPDSRRAAVVALGLIGSYQVNPVLARSLRDRDPIVRRLAQSALWAVWFRADSPENNATLGRVARLLDGDRPSEAIDLASDLIGRSPRFAEAYNQRAIAFFALGRYEESAADCRRVLERNPYHTGALAGLAKCYLELGRHADALSAFRRALDLQPFDDSLRETVTVLERAAD